MRVLARVNLKEWLVNFFSGFSFTHEVELFDSYLKKSDYSVSGFSLGAVKAFEYVLGTTKRVDTLQLFSPAFFQDRDKKFIRLQTISYQKNQAEYEKQFLKNIAYPSNYDMRKYYKKDNLNSLEKLLNFTWKREELERLKSKGVYLEVYLGEKDKIIDSLKAKEFFKTYATVYLIKEGGHILHG